MDSININSLYRLKSVNKKKLMLQKKSKRAVPVQEFQKKGNGMVYLKSKVGRLTDFKGIFLVHDRSKRIILAKSSKNVLQDLQKLARGKRAKDKRLLKKVANYFGYLTTLAGSQYLRSMRVSWIEIADDIERAMVLNRFQREVPIISK